MLITQTPVTLKTLSSKKCKGSFIFKKKKNRSLLLAPHDSFFKWYKEFIIHEKMTLQLAEYSKIRFLITAL